MEFDLDPTAITLTVILWGVIVFGIWFIKLGSSWSTPQRILLSVLALPITYLVTSWQLQRG